MTHLLSDLRFALRTFRRNPGFTAIAVLSIALGIGANTAIFTLVDQVLLRLLPVKNPQQLVQVTQEGDLYGSNWGDGSELSYPTYTEIRDRNKVFSGVFGRFGYDMHVGFQDNTDRARGEIVTGSYFPVLGVQPAVGRLLTPADDRLKGGHPVAVLSHAFWTSRFGADPSVVGRTAIVNGHPFTVVGVAQAGFDGIEIGHPVQVFVPMMMKLQITAGWDGLDDRLYRWVRVFGRLQDSETRDHAFAGLLPLFRSTLEADVKSPGFAGASTDARKSYLRNRLVLDPAAQGHSNFRREMTKPLWVLMAIAGGVLVIACANVANLLLARAAGRQREIATRLSLGATRSRLVQQLLVESLALSVVGGVAGLALAIGGAPLVLSFFVDPEGPPVVSTAPDLRILAFTFGLAVLTGIVFGLAPAFTSTRADLAPTLKAESTSVMGGRGRARKALVASQVAVSLLLLLGAGLFIRTLSNLTTVDLGLRTHNLIAFDVDPSRNGYDGARTRQFSKTLLERLQAIPGVESAGLATVRILEGDQWSSGMTIEGYQAKPREDMGQLCNAVSPAYFKTLGMPLVAGRDFEFRDEYTTDASDGQQRSFRVVIVNERFVNKYFSRGNAIGRRIGFGTDPGTKPNIEIIGVVKDAKYTDVRSEIRSQIFFPYLETGQAGGFVVYLRTTRDVDSAFTGARRTVRALDENLPVSGMRSLDSQVSRSLSNERLMATMSAVFGVLATALAIVGLYGVMAYTVARRTREIGIRMALGARGVDVGWLVMRETLTIAVIGAVAGLPIAWWLSRFIESQLYGVTPMDGASVGGSVLALAAAALVAGLAPTRRAVSVEPMRALRID
jgi:putative ABC transport system permease protein